MKNQEAKIYDRGEAYKYVLKEDHGFVDEIRISDELFRDFCNIGYIRMGMDGKWRERWQITEFGKEQFQSYLELFDQEEELESILKELDQIEMAVC